MSDKIEVPIDDADITLFSGVNLGCDYDELLVNLIDNVDWEQHSIKLFGRNLLQPRLSAWYGDSQAGYCYSGIRLKPKPWTGLLSDLKSSVESISSSSFNSVLLNYYRNQQDSMGMHSDDEKELGRQPVIASLSLGAERIFVLKHRFRKDLEPIKISLPSGSLLLMKGDTQSHWKHGILRQKKPLGARINLTFRLIR